MNRYDDSNTPTLLYVKIWRIDRCVGLFKYPFCFAKIRNQYFSVTGGFLMYWLDRFYGWDQFSVQKSVWRSSVWCVRFDWQMQFWSIVYSKSEPKFRIRTIWKWTKTAFWHVIINFKNVFLWSRSSVKLQFWSTFKLYECAILVQIRRRTETWYWGRSNTFLERNLSLAYSYPLYFEFYVHPFSELFKFVWCKIFNFLANTFYEWDF